MSRTKKEGKSSRLRAGAESGKAALLRYKRLWGSSEKTVRKHRQMWSRKLGKERRKLDRVATRESGVG